MGIEIALLFRIGIDSLCNKNRLFSGVCRNQMSAILNVTTRRYLHIRCMQFPLHKINHRGAIYLKYHKNWLGKHWLTFISMPNCIFRGKDINSTDHTYRISNLDVTEKRGWIDKIWKWIVIQDKIKTTHKSVYSRRSWIIITPTNFHSPCCQSHGKSLTLNYIPTIHSAIGYFIEKKNSGPFYFNPSVHK